MSPSTADTDALSRNVKINGIRRAVATKSTVSVVLVGVAGTIINNGIVSDKIITGGCCRHKLLFLQKVK